jgi:predicted NBD/HSP70 family sugar kinase
MNLAAVLHQVRAAGPCSRADLAATTGLHKATVSGIVAELIERRMVREIGLTAHRVGRPATMLVVDGGGYVGLGIEVGAEYLTAVAVDLADRLKLTWAWPVASAARHPDRLIDEIAALAQRATSQVHSRGGAVVGLHIAVPGLVDATGVVRNAATLDWTDVDLGADLRRALRHADYPVAVDSDATLGALAEYRYGEHAGTAYLAYVSDSMIGVIHEGTPLRGAHGYSAALGHLTVAYPPVGGLDQRAAGGDPAALSLLASIGTQLGYVVGLVTNLFNPSAVLLGGAYAPLAPWLLPAVEDEARRLAVAPVADLRLAAASLGGHAAAFGAAAAALDSIDPERRPLALPRRRYHPHVHHPELLWRCA